MAIEEIESRRENTMRVWELREKIAEIQALVEKAPNEQQRAKLQTKITDLEKQVEARLWEAFHGPEFHGEDEMQTVEVAQTADRSLLPAADSVITVDKGRGFIIEHRTLFDFGDGFKTLRRKLVVTASHCLPHPPVMPCYSYQETTYANLLAPLGEEPSVWAECLFFDPVSDLAILGEPSNQELGEENEAYGRLVDGRKPFTIAAPETGEGYMLALDGESWRPTPLKVHVTIWGTGLSSGTTLAGQSGSPIVDARGRAVALVSIGTEILSPTEGRVPIESGPQPILKFQLPSWLLKTMKNRPGRPVTKGK